jgi:hypothetical protein
MIDYPNLFPGGIVRAPPTPQDQQLGLPGQIIEINDLYFNFGDLRVAGFDGDLSYSIDTGPGKLTPSAAIANVFKYQSALAPGLPLVNEVSQANFDPGFAPRWKGTLALAWKSTHLSSSVMGRYIGRYKDYQEDNPNTNELGNFGVVDCNARYDFGKSPERLLPKDSYVSLGMINALNKQPQFSYGAIPYDPQEWDYRGRFIYAQAGLRW